MTQSVGVGFPLCADARADAAIRPLIARALSFLLRQVGSDAVEAVILTGSLARGEGSVLLEPDGFRLLGDAELLVILRHPFEWADARRRMAALSRQATHELGQDGRRALIEYAPAGIGYLHSHQPSIFAYDLQRHGKVLWGRAEILKQVRPFGVEAIPEENAVQLLMNRVIELLMLENGPRDFGADREGRAYQLTKTILDLAGSALAFAGRFASSYAERPRAFATLAASSPDVQEALPDLRAFEVELDAAARCKLFPAADVLFRGEPAERVVTVLQWAMALWEWQMRRLFRRPAAPFPDLVEAYVSHESLGRRLKGWAKYYWHPLRPRGTLDARRAARLLFRASPQALTYAAALLAHGGRVARRDDWDARAAGLLPVPARPGGGVVRQAGELWSWLVRNN